MTDDDEKDLWNQAIDAAIKECCRLLDHGKDDHLDSWMGNAINAIGKLRAPIMDEPRDQY